MESNQPHAGKGRKAANARSQLRIGAGATPRLHDSLGVRRGHVDRVDPRDRTDQTALINPIAQMALVEGREAGLQARIAQAAPTAPIQVGARVPEGEESVSQAGAPRGQGTLPQQMPSVNSSAARRADDRYSLT